MQNLSIFFIVFFVFQFTVPAQKGWFFQNPYPTTNYLYSVDFIDEFTGISVGENGTIVRTTDGGDTWSLQISGTTNHLNAVCFIDPENGIAVGEGGTILRTTNGGETWILNTTTTPYLNGVSFFDEFKGAIVGSEGTILTTTDGGINWIEQTSGTTSVLIDVCWINDSTAITVGDGGIILRTTDAGKTWIERPSPTSGILNAVSFPDSLTGYASIYEQFISMLKTTDGGISWVLLQNGLQKVRNICFIDSQNGYAVGYGGPITFTEGYIAKTTDGGVTWNTQWSKVHQYPFAVCLNDLINVTAVGNYGLILRSTDGGTTWYNQGSITTYYLTDVCFSDENHGIILGWESDYSTAGVIMRTTDGGNNWQPTFTTTVGQFYESDVSLVDSINGIIVRHNIISKTTDGGINREA